MCRRTAKAIGAVGVKIAGVPYGQEKPHGDRRAPLAWSQAIVDQTRQLPKLTGTCLLRVRFRLPPDKYPQDHPFGSDLDNLLKRFCDALKQTVFSAAPGTDGCIVALVVSKIPVATKEMAGADVEIVPQSGYPAKSLPPKRASGDATEA